MCILQLTLQLLYPLLWDWGYLATLLSECVTIDGAGALLVCLCGVALFSFYVPTCSSRFSWCP